MGDTETEPGIRSSFKIIHVPETSMQEGDEDVLDLMGNTGPGPGTVIGVDGKVIFVKHGRLHITASPSRLIKANHVFKSYGSVIDSLGPQQENLKNKKNDVSSLGKVDEESEDDNPSTGASGGLIDTAPAVIAENQAPDGVEVNDTVPSLPENMENE